MPILRNHGHVDGESSLEDAKRVADHLKSCAACRHDVELHRRLDGILTSIGNRTSVSDVLSPRLATRARAAVRRSRHRRLSFGLGAAASLLLVPCFFFFWNRIPPPAPTDELVRDLDILEAFHEEGIEPTSELVNILLAEDGENGSEILAPEIFDYLLEEEIWSENL